MNDRPSESLEDRMKRLEATVAQLQQVVQQLQANLLKIEPKTTEPQPLSKSTSGVKVSPTPASAATDRIVTGSSATFVDPATERTSSESVPSAVRPAGTNQDWLQNWEFWLNRLGIGLLLLGVAFLFKYSIDQGWLTPSVRIGFGAALGLTLLGLGLRLQSSRRAFSQILLGGSIGTFYLTGYAAFQLFQLFSFPGAMVWMVATTLVGFFLSLRQEQAVLSVLATVGGLATPFLLYSGSGSPTGLVAYTCVILAAAIAIYFRQGWRSLLWTTFVGTTGVFIATAIAVSSPTADQYAVQAGVIFSWFLFAIAPVLRVICQQKTFSGLLRYFAPLSNFPITPPLNQITGLGLLNAVIALMLTGQLWNLSAVQGGTLALGFAGFYGLMVITLQRIHPPLVESQILAGFLMLAIALTMLLAGDWQFLLLTLEAVILHGLARWQRKPKLELAAHLFWVAIGLRLVARLFGGQEAGLAVFNLPAIVDLVAIAAAVGLAIKVIRPSLNWIYLVSAHLCLLVWIVRELSPLSTGYVTVAWGVYAIALLVLGLLRDLHLLRIAGLTTLLLVVGKLFFNDLADLEPIWRILLFIGFGGVFLALSYASRSLWRSPKVSLPPSPTPSPRNTDQSPPE